MSFNDLLINTCTIKRFTEGAQDAYGIPAKTWADIVVDEPCRWSYPTNREVKVGAEVVIADLQLFLDSDAEITEQDRVLMNNDGSFPYFFPIIFSVTYEVISVANKQDGTGHHHLECLLRAIQ